MNKDQVCIALDVDDFEQIKHIVEQLHPYVGWFKINSAFTKYGAQVVDYIKSKGCKLFLDLKFHDIPNTVANYASIATSMGIDMFNVHATGGLEMMKAAKDAAQMKADQLHIQRPLVIAVTVLTSMDEAGLKSISVDKSIADQVLTLAQLTKDSGLDGVVASAQEAELILSRLGDDFLIITPGIRPKWSAGDDQKRIVTPKLAVEMGANLLVIGRPVTAASDMRGAVEKIIAELDEVCDTSRGLSI